MSSRQGHRVLQLGFLLFLAGLIVGLLVPRFTVPRLALSTHLLGITQGMFLMLLGGVVWPRLSLGPGGLRAASWLAAIGCVAAWLANLLGAISGAGHTMVPMAAGQARGSALAETVMAVALRGAALALIATTLLILWGLRAARDPG